MPERSEIARQAAAGLRRFAGHADRPRLLIGFDGFIDSIIQIVDKRHDAHRYQPIPTIEAFGRRIAAAAGQSTNFEMVTTLRKLGGNGPIMANALAAAGQDITYVGALGLPEPDPVFEELVDRAAEVHSVDEAGATDALEFGDGKLLMGKYAHLADLGYETIRQRLGDQAFIDIVARSAFIGTVNWTMLPASETIWTELSQRILPQVGPDVGGRRRIIFVDLADPQKRTTEDLQRALGVLRDLGDHADVILGTNLKESGQVAAALGLPAADDPEAEIEATACAIREALDLHAVVVHPRRGAAGAIRTADGVASAAFAGPFVARPRLSTGAGDNFNAGFCLGILAGLPVEQALCTGTATSGYYVRHAASPTLEELAAFCEALPDPEGAVRV